MPDNAITLGGIGVLGFPFYVCVKVTRGLCINCNQGRKFWYTLFDLVENLTPLPQ